MELAHKSGTDGQRCYAIEAEAERSHVVEDFANIC